MCQAARRIGVNNDVNMTEVTLQHRGEQNVACVLEADLQTFYVMPCAVLTCC